MKKLVITGLAVALSVSTAHAASIWLVDIDGRNDTTDPGGDWNLWNMHDLGAARGDNTLNGIVDQNGLNPLTAQVTAVSGAHGRQNTGASTTTLTLAGQPVINAVIGNGAGGGAHTWNGNNTSDNTVDFTISGLDPTKQYSMSFLMAVAGDFGAGSYQNPTWSIDGASTVNGSQSIYDDVNGVSTGTSTVFNPQGDGTIDIQITIPSRTAPGRHTVEAFAIEEVVPEPGSLALMAIGGTLVTRRRRPA